MLVLRQFAAEGKLGMITLEQRVNRSFSHDRPAQHRLAVYLDGEARAL